MRLLLITQKVDKDDDVLGVYHHWIEELAKKVENISVICLYKGTAELPPNVQVYSLGKEDGISRIKYLFNFYKYLWQLRGKYDRVFAHMNPEYMLLAGIFWRSTGKKPILWYNHPMGDLKARIAISLAERVLHTSPFAFAARYKKAVLMPVGIDTNLFKKISGIAKKPKSILYLGRISPIKFIEVLIESAFILDKEGVDFFLTIAGEPSKESEIAYANSIKRSAEPLVKKGKIIFTKGVPNYKTPELYNAHEICVNMTPTGSFDKTIIETMACESLVIASNKAISDVLPRPLFFEEKNAADLARALKSALNLSGREKEEIGTGLRKYVLGRHDLGALIERLSEILK